MKAVDINIEQLKEYIDIAFEGDIDILKYYDKSIQVDSIADVAESIFDKCISVKEQVKQMAVFVDDEKAGYLVFSPSSLVSFGLNKKFRISSYLASFWDLIKKELGNDFECGLYDYNERAINWLKKCGMQIVFKNLTILKLCQQ